MKPTLLLLSIFALVGCLPERVIPIPSPTGLYSVTPEVSGDEAGPDRSRCVRLRILHVSTKREIVYQTASSDRMKWAAAWSGDSVVLYSSDVGTNVYEIHDGTILARPPSEAEKEVGRTAYEKKYGNRPRA
jgi:hypothetical protein